MVSRPRSQEIVHIHAWFHISIACMLLDTFMMPAHEIRFIEFTGGTTLVLRETECSRSVENTILSLSCRFMSAYVCKSSKISHTIVYPPRKIQHRPGRLYNRQVTLRSKIYRGPRSLVSQRSRTYAVHLYRTCVLLVPRSYLCGTLLFSQSYSIAFEGRGTHSDLRRVLLLFW
jgi:hypothetical protein